MQYLFDLSLNIDIHPLRLGTMAQKGRNTLKWKESHNEEGEAWKQRDLPLKPIQSSTPGQQWYS